MERKCIICEREFRVSGRGIGLPRRYKSAKTCSMNCSKIFARVKKTDINIINSKLSKQRVELRRMIKEFENNLKEKLDNYIDFEEQLFKEINKLEKRGLI